MILLVLEDGQKFLIIFLIFSDFERRSNAVARSASEHPYYLAVQCHHFTVCCFWQFCETFDTVM